VRCRAGSSPAVKRLLISRGIWRVTAQAAERAAVPETSAACSAACSAVTAKAGKSRSVASGAIAQAGQKLRAGRCPAGLSFRTLPVKRLLIWVGCCSTQGNNEREGVVQEAASLSSACLSAEASGASLRKRLNGQLCSRPLQPALQPALLSQRKLVSPDLLPLAPLRKRGRNFVQVTDHCKPPGRGPLLSRTIVSRPFLATAFGGSQVAG